ncbi:MAG TPA: V-type ATP synthase subunit A [Candidatus Limnocylindrales bacterium]|nr:V-type ATP synthase subunit A [Candidatus Limnocylindrales bacterium]
MANEGIIVRVSGPTVAARNMGEARMHHRVRVGEAGLLGEVIRLEADLATIQVYEDTTGLRLGEKVTDVGEPLLVELGPGLLTSVFDGVQRPLDAIRNARGDFIVSGISAPPLDRAKRWEFHPSVKEGQRVGPGDVIGVVPETSRIEHRVTVPPSGGGRIREVREGALTITEPAAVLEDGTPLGLAQRWPVRTPRPFLRRLPPTLPFVTGQRVFDVLFPLAIGATAIVPGGFGTGKTVVEQTLAKYAESDIIIFVGCGERGNEMTEVLSDFPTLTDPRTGRPILERTVLIVNTSNMPVAAREASVYTGITIAEYYRDMGYRVALMADSISRWAEALREISSRLEEMPGEEGYPTYLATRLAGFYERGGRVVCQGEGEREGTVTIVSAVSPPGGDFSEPVTQSSQRIAGVLWALDPELAHRRHFPAVDWKRSYSLYLGAVDDWFRNHVAPDWPDLRREMMGLLQREEELQEIVQLVGIESLQDQERIVLTVSGMLREDFLRQSAFSENDATCPPEKAYFMLKAILTFHSLCRDLLGKGAPVEKVLSLPFREELGRMKEFPAEGFREAAGALIARIETERRADR